METHEIVLNEIRKGTVKPVYIFSGEEEYFKRELQQKFRIFLTDSATDFFNYEVVDGKECDVSSLIMKCRTVPFFSTVRLLVVKNADELCSSQELTEYIQNPSSSTCLVLMVQKSPSSLRKYEIKLNKLDNRKRAEWIKKKVQEFKKETTYEAAQLLQEFAGEELERLSSEIEKLVLFVGEKPSISREDVLNARPAGSQEMSIFNLTDAIGNRDKKQALRILGNLVLAEDTGRILGMIARQFRLILQSKELMKKGYSQARIAQEIEIKHGWLVGKLLGQAGNFSRESLINKFEVLADAELNIKNGTRDESSALKILMGKLCSQ